MFIIPCYLPCSCAVVAGHHASSVPSTVSPGQSMPCHYPERPAACALPAMDSATLASPRTHKFTNETSHSCLYLPPPHGSLQYSAVNYLPMDPLDPDQPAPSKSKKPKTTETRQSSLPQQQSLGQVQNKLSARDDSQLTRKIRLSQTPTKPPEKHHDQPLDLSAVDTSDLGFFSTSFSNDLTVYRYLKLDAQFSL